MKKHCLIIYVEKFVISIQNEYTVFKVFVVSY